MSFFSSNSPFHGLTKGPRVRLLIAAAIWLLLAPLALTPAYAMLSLRFFDWFSTFQPPVPEDTPVIIVGIDEPSFAEIGQQWPWSREIHGRLIDSLSRAGAAVIAFDIVFAEPSSREADKAMAKAIHKAGNVLLAADEVEEETDYLSQRIIVTPTPELLEAGAGTGVAAVSLDPDGAIRLLPLYDDGFALSTLRIWQAANAEPPSSAPSGSHLLQFFGPPQTYPYVSYYQALEPEKFLPPDLFRNRIVIIGQAVKTSPNPEARQSDIFMTPFTYRSGLLTPGVEIHATIIDNLRRTLFISKAGEFLQPLGLAIVVLVSIFVFQGWHPWRGAISAFGLLAIIMISSYALLRLGRTWLPPPLFLAGVLMSYAGEGGMAFLREREGRERIKKAFSHYLSPALVEQLAADPSRLKLGGEKKELTVMFCDVRGFTTLSEQYKDAPETLVRLMNRFLTVMTDVILKWGGTVDKYIGDCIMAFWNAPLDDLEHAQHACAAALEMCSQLQILNAELAAEEDTPQLKIGIGINTGHCIVGNVGSNQRFDYSLFGDAVNLASRLEGQSKFYGVDIVIGPTTASRVKDFTLLELDFLAVKGKEEAVRVFGLLGSPFLEKGEQGHSLLRIHDRMLKAYRQQKWQEATSALAEARALAPGLTMFFELYQTRIAEYEKNAPGAEWDGVFRALSK